MLCCFFLSTIKVVFLSLLFIFISYLLVLLITFGIIFFFIVLYFFVIFTFEINSYYSIKFQKLNSACAAASLDQMASRLTVWIFSKKKESE